MTFGHVLILAAAALGTALAAGLLWLIGRIGRAAGWDQGDKTL